MVRVVFVCTGNTCRSPMAEYILQKLINENEKLRDEIEVISAGVAARSGNKATPEAIDVLKEEDLDLSGHQSKLLDDEMVKKADLLLTMTTGHKEMILQKYPWSLSKVFTLKEFAGEDGNIDIYDPFGQSLGVYRETKEEIKESLHNLIGKLEQFIDKEGNQQKVENKNKRGGKQLRIAIGSDHAGYEIKKIICDFLEEEGYDYADMGTDTTSSVDYPDFAYRVAHGVAKGDYDRGILICGTGIGMSIAANKVKGVRAALCHDVFSARATRNHNNSNVLTMGARVVGSGLALEIVQTWLGEAFDGGRHQRRIDKITDIERGEYKGNE